jgi:hypothetical protein
MLAVTLAAQASKMFRSGEHPVIPGLPKPQAEALKVEFEALGATVRLGSAGSDSWTQSGRWVMLMHHPGNRRVPAAACRFAMSCTSRGRPEDLSGRFRVHGARHRAVL